MASTLTSSEIDALLKTGNTVSTTDATNSTSHTYAVTTSNGDYAQLRNTILRVISPTINYCCTSSSDTCCDAATINCYTPSSKESNSRLKSIADEWGQWKYNPHLDDYLTSAYRELIKTEEKDMKNTKTPAPIVSKIPDCISVETYNDRVVIVYFEDGTWTKAVTSENDVFDIDVGITICLIKRILGGQKDGTKGYSKYLKHVHKVMEKNEKAKQEEAEKKAEERRKRKQNEMKRKAGRLKAKEEQIDIVKQGLERALQERDLL